MGDTMKVRLDKDEWYPVYGMSERLDWLGDYTVEVPVEKWHEYKRVLGEFNEMHEYIRDLYEAARKEAGDDR